MGKNYLHNPDMEAFLSRAKQRSYKKKKKMGKLGLSLRIKSIWQKAHQKLCQKIISKITKWEVILIHITKD